MLIRKTIYLLALFLLSGCASSYAPIGWLPEADKVEQDPYGAWVSVEPVITNPKLLPQYTYISGELIGIDSSNIYLLHDSLVVVPMDSIKKAITEVADNDKEHFVGWGVLGSASTISHGILLIFTLPMWIITSSVITSNESYSNRYEEKIPTREYWKSMIKYSRFPQGIPPGLDLQKLKPRVPHDEESDEEDSWYGLKKNQ